MVGTSAWSLFPFLPNSEFKCSRKRHRPSFRSSRGSRRTASNKIQVVETVLGGYGYRALQGDRRVPEDVAFVRQFGGCRGWFRIYCQVLSSYTDTLTDRLWKFFKGFSHSGKLSRRVGRPLRGRQTRVCLLGARVIRRCGVSGLK
jgi:hypothetical protein